ncbi:MAG: dihydroorotate dehydrogenase [Thermoleophilia bacterium]|nr:dihydroorotate dehydrogenase [Thermoleophilia bacterium]
MSAGRPERRPGPAPAAAGRSAAAPVPEEGVDLRVSLGPVELEHPLVDASGTFDAVEYARRARGDFFAAFPYAAYVPKTVTVEPRAGNPPPRVTETAAGMINAIGLANPGVDAWLGSLSELEALRQPMLVSVGGNAPEHYAAVVRAVEAWAAGRAGARPAVAGYELNVSCPNLSGGLLIGAEPAATAEVVAAVRAETGRPVFTKLTPNVTDVLPVAAAALEAGSTGLALVNTFKALVLEPKSLRPFLGNRTGGLCGPAIKPIALRLVAEVAAAFPGVPLVGMGGVVCGLDALEFIACGATAVAVGAANFKGVEVPRRILAELRRELAARGFAGVSEARGVALAGA